MRWVVVRGWYLEHRTRGAEVSEVTRDALRQLQIKHAQPERALRLGARVRRHTELFQVTYQGSVHEVEDFERSGHAIEGRAADASAAV